MQRRGSRCVFDVLLLSLLFKRCLVQPAESARDPKYIYVQHNREYIYNVYEYIYIYYIHNTHLLIIHSYSYSIYWLICLFACLSDRLPACLSLMSRSPVLLRFCLLTLHNTHTLTIYIYKYYYYYI